MIRGRRTVERNRSHGSHSIIPGIPATTPPGQRETASPNQPTGASQPEPASPNQATGTSQPEPASLNQATGTSRLAGRNSRRWRIVGGTIVR